jgi:glycerol dehydrogenase-like iron-containing ADH family enzyme
MTDERIKEIAEKHFGPTYGKELRMVESAIREALAEAEKGLPNDEEIHRVSIEQNEDDIADQIVWRFGAKWLRSRVSEK